MTKDKFQDWLEKRNRELYLKNQRERKGRSVGSKLSGTSGFSASVFHSASYAKGAFDAYELLMKDK